MKLPGLPSPAATSGSAEGWSDHEEDATVEALRRASEGLSPDDAALDRMYAISRQAFREARYERSVRVAGRPRAPRRLRLAAAFSLALLTVSGAGVVAAAESGPGEPFYRTRLTIEAAFLPGAGSTERLTADLDRAQARIDEALSAAAAGNSNAEADALGAYSDIVGSMPVPDDEALRLQMRERLSRQLSQLQTLSAGGSTVAELERAMERVGQLLQGSGQTTPTPAPTGQGPNSTPSHEPGSSGDGPKASPSGGPNPSSSPGGPGGGQGSGAGGPGETQGPKAP